MNQSIKSLRSLGQGIWIDDIHRGMIESGELKRMIEEDGISGLTSNPTIFEKAINGSDDYDSEIERLAKEGKSANEIYEALVFKDISDAAELMSDTFAETGTSDGFVSIEVSPHLAYDADKTMSEVERLHRAIDKRNLFVKVPGTLPGIEVIKQAIGKGHNINVTLLFSIDNYEAVARAYIDGLRRYRETGGDISKVASVASFFLSRIDTKVDSRIDQRVEAGDPDSERLKALRGRTAIAVAKIVYHRFLDIFSGPDWDELAAAGARVQKPLWASTGTKDPSYSDVKYVEPLIGANTINTLPIKTLEAFLDHGRVELSVGMEYEESVKVLDELVELNIDLKEITDILQTEGVKQFADSFDKLMEAIEKKMRSQMQP